MINFFDINAIVLLPLITAFIITALLTFFTIKLVKKLGLLDDPKLHKHPGIIHTKPIPRGGGIALFFGAFITSLFFIPFTNPIIAIFFAAFLALSIGLIDDKLNAKSKDVSPYLRFLINILKAVIFVGSGVSIHFITKPF
jgi:UDP-GlcNAc:undecaprenyl-phosphate GlcNAc-1-phosphate transferase